MDAVVLDVGGVFLIPHPDPIVAALEPHGIEIDVDRIDLAHYVGVVALDERTGPGEERDRYLAAFLRALGVPPVEIARAVPILEASWSQKGGRVWRKTVPGSQDALRRLVDAGHTVAILSNADGTVEEQLREYGICQVGDGHGAPVCLVADSTVVGIAKPDVGIFHHVAEAIGVAPERCIYVGDTVRYDVLGARAAGFHPYHFDPYSLCVSTDVHPHLRALSELTAYL